MAYFFHVLMIVQRGNVRLFWFIEFEQELEDGTFYFFGGSLMMTGTRCFPRECERSQSPSRGLSDHALREHWLDERKQHAVAGAYQRLRPVDSPASQRSSYIGCTLLSLFSFELLGDRQRLFMSEKCHVFNVGSAVLQH